MKRWPSQPTFASLIPVCLLLALTGCERMRLKRELYSPPAPPAPLGTLSDQIYQIQETNAEASDFVVYQHEFDMDSRRLNTDGEDHVKEIAQRLQAGQSFPVVVERSMMSKKPGTEFEYPVHPNPALDLQRREVIVRSLAAMGVTDAEDRVVVAPAFATGLTAVEAERAYYSGISSSNNYGGAFGFGSFNAFGGFFGFGR